MARSITGSIRVRGISLLLAAILLEFPCQAKAQATQEGDAQSKFVQYSSIPLHFEQNVGQTDEQVKFLTRGRGYSLFLTRSEAVLSLTASDGSRSQLQSRGLKARKPALLKRSIIRLGFQQAQPSSSVAGVDELEGSANYLIGNDPKRWHTDVPLFRKVKYSQLYRGIDLVYYGNEGQLEYDLVLAPNADPNVIHIRVDGVDEVGVTKTGGLRLVVPAGTLTFKKPHIYQIKEGSQQSVDGGYVLTGHNDIGFKISRYDRSKPLVVDPVLEYATYLGGSGQEMMYGNEMAVDASGNVYVEGLTTSSDFPATTTIGTIQGNGSDVLFVSKMNSSLTSLMYTTYIGGTGNNVPYYNGPDEPTGGIAVDSNGYVYISGVTVATDFPITSNAFQSAIAAGAQVTAFVSKLTADGKALLYSSYLGGNAESWAQAIAVDNNQCIYLTGWSTSTSPVFPLTPTAFQTVNRSQYGDAVVSKIDTTKAGAGSLVYSSFIGGSSTSTIGDMGNAIATDSTGKIYVTGITSSTDFPVTSTAYQSTGGNPPNGNVFLSEFDPTQSGAASVVYSTYFGNTGNGVDMANALALDRTGKVRIGGIAAGCLIPTTISSSGDAFLAEFDTTKANAASLVYSRCFGSASISAAVESMTVDASGDTYVGGYTLDTAFPITQDAVQSANRGYPGGASGFVSIFSADATSIIYSTYFGSSGSAAVKGIALDSAGNIYITGFAQGIDLPTTQQLFQPTLQGSSDLFLARFGGITTPAITNLSTSSGFAGTPITISGLNFGSSGTVTFNGVPATPSSWTPTSIVVPVPAGAKTGNIVVAAGGTASNGMPFTVLSGAIPIVLVQHAKNSAGTTTSARLAFASNNSAGDWIGVCVRASGTSQSLSVSDSNGNLYRQALSVNETGGGNTLAMFYAENIVAGSNTVTVSNPVSSNLQVIILEYSGVATYASVDTTISAAGSSTTPNSGTATTNANGDLLLSSVITASAASFTAGSGYTEEDFLPLASNTDLITEDEILSQAGAASSTATLAASGTWAVGLAAFKNGGKNAGPVPTITGLNPPTGSNGTVVTISGYNFGAIQGSVTFNGTVASPTSWTDSAITVKDPTGATDGYVVVTVSGVSSNGVWFAQPKITGTSPGSAAVGAAVTINGSHFGTTPGVVRFNGIIASATWGASSITTTVPVGATTGPVVVTNSNGIVSNGQTFTVTGTVPKVTSLTPSTGAVGTPVTIKGSGFGASQGSSTVTFNGVPAGTAGTWAAGTITISVPTGASTGNVVVTVGGLPDLQTNVFTVPGTPSVSGMSPTRGGIGAEITITGSNLGTSGTVKVNGTAANIWSWSPTLIVVPVPSGATSGSVVVTASGVQVSAGVFEVRSPIPSTATEFSYDGMGRVIQKTVCTPMNCGTGQAPSSLSVTYDLAGETTSISFNGPIISYGYDTAGRVTQVTSNLNDSQHPGTLATVDAANGYWPTGVLRKLTFGNNLTESDVYNSRGQPCRINVNSSGTLLSNCSDALPTGNFQDFNNNYNAGTTDNGDVAGFKGTGQQNFNRTYVYDSLNRIQSMSAPGDQCSGLSWTIDAWGNRTGQNNQGGTCLSPSVSVGTNNRLAAGAYQYDTSGDLTNDGTHSYTYDGEGRITKVDAGATATYVYDAFGTRVEKTASGSDSQYVYDQNGQMNTVFSNGASQRAFVYMGGAAIAQYFENTTYFIHLDHLGSTRLLTKLDRTVRESEDYYPFGELIPSVPATGDVNKFTGKERDGESGLDNFGARYFGSSFGRFMTPDWAAKPTTVPYASFGDPQSLNLYAYVRNNPLSRNDPDGHKIDCINNTVQCQKDLQKLAPGTKVDENGHVHKSSLLHRALNHLDGHGAGTALVTRLVNNSETVKVNPDPTQAAGNAGAGIVNYNPNGASGVPERNSQGNIVIGSASGVDILGHELIHQDHRLNGGWDSSIGEHVFEDSGQTFSEFFPKEELRTVGFEPFVKKGDITENQLRHEQGEPDRATYDFNYTPVNPDQP